VGPQIVGRHLLHWPGVPDRSAGHDRIDAAEVIGHALHHGTHRPLVTKVRRDGQARHAGRSELISQHAGLLQRTVGVDRHGIAARGQCPNDRRSHASFTTGDKRHAARLRKSPGDKGKWFVHQASPGKRAGRQRQLRTGVAFGKVSVLIAYACVFIVSWKSRICCQASSAVSA
jgi:hypothetical protein